MNGKMMFYARKLQQRLVSHLYILYYISLHLYYNIKGFSLSPENTILTFMYSCTTSLYIHTQDLGKQVVLYVTRIFLPWRWFLGLWIKHDPFIEMDVSVPNSGAVEGIGVLRFSVLQVYLSFRSIKKKFCMFLSPPKSTKQAKKQNQQKPPK